MKRKIPEKLLLFDIDGVLLRNLGYRGAFSQSLEKYMGNAGIMNWHPGPEELAAYFESTGVTSEWDMIPIALAAAYEILMQRCYPPDSIQTREDFEAFFSGYEPWQDIDLAPLLKMLTPEFGKEKLAATHLYNLYKHTESPEIDAFPLFHKRAAFESLLKDTRDILGCHITRQFQNRIIGSHLFEEVYSQKALFPTGSALQELDQVNLSDGNYNRLLEKVHSAEVGACLMTARPTYPPKELPMAKIGFSPEGEIAVKLLKMEWLPLIGYGRLTVIARQNGIIPEKILKPSPFQALASILAAAFGKEYDSLTLAWEMLYETGNFNGLPNALEIHVFEDSYAGLRSCISAADILRQKGLEIDLHLWGISTHPGKMDALREAGARIEPDVNAALDRVLG